MGIAIDQLSKRIGRPGSSDFSDDGSDRKPSDPDRRLLPREYRSAGPSGLSLEAQRAAAQAFAKAEGFDIAVEYTG